MPLSQGKSHDPQVLLQKKDSAQLNAAEAIGDTVQHFNVLAGLPKPTPSIASFEYARRVYRPREPVH